VAVIGEASESVTEGYVVHDAQGAWLAENGDLAVCLLGLAPDRSDAQFSIMVPARDMVGPGDGDSISGYLVPPGSIVSPCGPPPQGARAIPIEFVAAVGPDPQQERYWQPAPDLDQALDADLGQAPAGDQEPAPEAYQELDPDGNQGLVTAAQYMQGMPPTQKYTYSRSPGPISALPLFTGTRRRCGAACDIPVLIFRRRNHGRRKPCSCSCP